MKKNSPIQSPAVGLIALCVLIPLLLVFAHSRNTQAVLLFAFAFAYSAWGIFDHYSSSPVFLKKVALEYLLIAAIGLAPLTFLIYY